MIPNRIFMVWFGNAAPAYAQCAADAFKRQYRDYSVEFIRYRVRELQQIRAGRVKSDIDGVVFDTMHGVFDFGKTGCYSEYIKNQQKIYGRNMNSTMLLSDIFRLELLNAFGGIYIDVDSVPGKRFDDALMANDRFCVCRNYDSAVIPDNYFMGQSEGHTRWVNPMDASSAVQVFDGTVHDVMFQYRRAKFIRSQGICEQNQFYIEHYMVRSWESMGGRTVDDFMPPKSK